MDTIIILLLFPDGHFRFPSLIGRKEEQVACVGLKEKRRLIFYLFILSFEVYTLWFARRYLSSAAHWKDVRGSHYSITWVKSLARTFNQMKRDWICQWRGLLSLSKAMDVKHIPLLSWKGRGLQGVVSLCVSLDRAVAFWSRKEKITPVHARTLKRTLLAEGLATAELNWKGGKSREFGNSWHTRVHVTGLSISGMVLFIVSLKEKKRRFPLAWSSFFRRGFPMFTKRFRSSVSNYHLKHFGYPIVIYEAIWEVGHCLFCNTKKKSWRLSQALWSKGQNLKHFEILIKKIRWSNCESTLWRACLSIKNSAWGLSKTRVIRQAWE